MIALELPMAQAASKLPAGAAEDWTIAQDWASYTKAEHALWDRLFARQSAQLVGRAVPAFLHGLDVLHLSKPGIPDFAELSERLDEAHRLERRRRAGPGARRGVLRPPGESPFRGRALHPPPRADRLPAGAGRLPRHLRPRAAAVRPGVRRLHAGLRRGRPARRAAGRHRAAGAALLAHGGVRPDPHARRACASTARASSPATARASMRWTTRRRRASPSTCGG